MPRKYLFVHRRILCENNGSNNANTNNFLVFHFPQFSLTPLHLACWYGQENVARLLLEHGANANAVDRVR